MSVKYDIQFTKAAASGNDFMIIDDKSRGPGARDTDYAEMARDLCRRRVSVGADGILVLEDSSEADFRMRVINPDGSEVDMCGNGARCSALYAAKKGWGEDPTFQTGAGVLSAEVNGDRVKIRMSDPEDIRLGFNLGVGSSIMNVHSLNTGVPHVVHIAEEVEDYPVRDTGRKIREHPNFAPEGTNVDFVGDIKDNRAFVRTYERGVEDETLACGTGTVASAVVLGLLGYAVPPVKMLTRSGEELTVYYRMAGARVTDVYLEGTACLIYEGRV